MKKAQILILFVMLAVGLIGCGKGENLETTELIESGNEELESTEASREKTEENMEPGSTEDLPQDSDRVYGKECMGVFTISINPEVDLEIDKDGNVLSVIFQNEDAETAYKDLSLEGIQAEDAVKVIVGTADEKGYLKDAGEVTLVYGSTGNASAVEARDMIDDVRDAIMDTLNELGKDSVVALEMENCTQDTSDICDLCFGVGSIICDQCGGVGYGNGMVTCDLCMGTGIYDDGHIPEEGGGPVDDRASRNL